MTAGRFDLAAGGVAVHEFVILGGASDDDGASSHGYLPAFLEPVNAETRSLSTSAVMGDVAEGRHVLGQFLEGDGARHLWPGLAEGLT